MLCTTTAEALAMGKFVLAPSHPSNDFFAQFPNCLTYTNKEEFVGTFSHSFLPVISCFDTRLTAAIVGNLYYALTHSPEPLTQDASYALSWGAATKRLERAASIPVKEAELMNEALSSKAAGIEVITNRRSQSIPPHGQVPHMTIAFVSQISLPPFIEDVNGRKLVASTLIRSRTRYRQYRSRLSQEIQQSNGMSS